MKFFIQQVYKEQFEIDIPQDTTLEQLRKLLISQYSYPDQQMKFINNGNILKDPNGLMNVKEFGRIIVYIKNKDSKKSHKRSKKVHTEENTKDEKNASAEEKSEKETIQQEVVPDNPVEEQNNLNGIDTNSINDTNNNNNENSNENDGNENNSVDNNNAENNNAESFANENNSNKNNDNENNKNANNRNENNSKEYNYSERNEQYQDPYGFTILNDSGPLFYHLSKDRFEDHSYDEIPKEKLDFYLSDCFKKIHLKQLYDEKCNFYANLGETRRIADMIDHNPGLNLVVYQFTKENFSMAIQRKTIDLESAMELAGFVTSSPISIADDYDAMYSEMPTIYTQIVKKLMKKYKKSQRETVKAFVESNYDEQEAEKLLQN